MHDLAHFTESIAIGFDAFGALHRFSSCVKGRLKHGFWKDGFFSASG
jgi:hypothetical protein